MQQPVLARKNDSQEILFDEIMRERAAVLGRAGFAVEDALAALEKIDREIRALMEILGQRCSHAKTGGPASQDRSLYEAINERIEAFNDACAAAEIKYYYLIVTREAMGLRRHETVKQMYAIPPKKKKLQAF